MEKFHFDRLYNLHLILGNADAGPFWVWSQWLNVANAIDPLMQTKCGPVAVRCTQFLKGTRDPVRFTEIGWSEQEHAKWTHASPVSGDESSGWDFYSIEVWNPGWTTCSEQGSPPDVFFAMKNVQSFGRTVVTFNPVIVLAVATDAPEGIQKKSGEAVDALEMLLKAKLRAFKTRTWAKPFGGFAFTEALPDLLVAGLFKGGQIANQPPTLDILREEWEITM